MNVEFEFPGFPRLANEHDENTWRYIERYNAHCKQYRPWEREAPAPPPQDLRLPYREPGEDDE